VKNGFRTKNCEICKQREEIRIIKSSPYFEKLMSMETVSNKGLSRLNNLSKGAQDQRFFIIKNLMAEGQQQKNEDKRSEGKGRV
jgi:hypothetical protein